MFTHGQYWDCHKYFREPWIRGNRFATTEDGGLETAEINLHDLALQATCIELLDKLSLSRT